MVETQIDQIVLDCNRLALDNLSKGNAKACLHLLRRAQDLLNTPDFPESKTRLTIITLNNLGCYHKASNKYSLALQAFQKAFDLKADQILDKQQAAEIHINVCFIRDFYSQFDNLLFHAKSALEHLQSCEVVNKELMPLTLWYLGKAFQGLDQPKHALQLFKQGLEIAYKELGHSHAVTCNLLQSYLALSKMTQVPTDLLPANKYKFEHKTCRTPDHFAQAKIAANAPSKLNIGPCKIVHAPTKLSPVKPDKRLVNDLYFEEPKGHTSCISRPCRTAHALSESKKLVSTSKASLSGSKRNLSISGRNTPEIKLRSTSSSQSTRISETNLPHIRASSSRQRTSINSKQSEIPNRISQIIEADLSFNNSTKQPDTKRPTPPSAKKKPPSSAHPVHFRKPSTESLLNSTISDNLYIPKPPLQPKPPKPPAYNLSSVVFIQKMWRGFMARKNFKVIRRKAASIKAQKAVAELEELKKLAKLESFEVKDIRKNIISLSRQLPVIPEVKAEYSDGPIILIQKNIRMFLARKRYMKTKKAAIKIQSYIKMLSVKDLYQNIRSAIIFIQRFWRLTHPKQNRRV